MFTYSYVNKTFVGCFHDNADKCQMRMIIYFIFSYFGHSQYTKSQTARKETILL